MKKFKMFFNMEREEQWLNEQLQKGYRCTNISGLGIYTFKKTDKRYVMRLDYQDYLSKSKFEEYKGMYEDFGWIYIKGYRIGGILYWQKEEDEQNEIFSDRQSMANYYKRLMGFTFWLTLLCMFFSPMPYKESGLYHEDLWSMNGSLLWKAFLFETPFVLLKLFPTIMAVLFGISLYTFYRKYSMFKEK